MHHAVGSSTLAETEAAVAEAVARGLEGMDGRPVTLACLFLTPHHAGDSETVVETVLDGLDPAHLLGCSAENLIAGKHEISGDPGIALWLAHWPGAEVHSFHLEMDGSPEAPVFDGWPDPMPPNGTRPAFLLLADPFTTPVDALLDRLNRNYPGGPAFGGLASGGWTPGMNRMVVNDTIYDRGVGVAMITGGVRVETLVSQGCRPIGKPYVITKADRNVLLELGGKPALAQLHELFSDLTPAERQLAERALHVGQVINERQDSFEQGDFLVRNVMGIDPERGGVAVGELMRPGRTVQFHVRDAASAEADLRSVLAARRKAGPVSDQAGVLFVSCNGRGQHLFGRSDADSGAVDEVLGPVPAGGFFAAGEIGPVGETNYLHGFTASLALFSPVA